MTTRRGIMACDWDDMACDTMSRCLWHSKGRLPVWQAALVGGAEEDRTPDLNTASVALSQLSYSPTRPAGAL
jgi:hypothetical protein